MNDLYNQYLQQYMNKPNNNSVMCNINNHNSNKLVVIVITTITSINIIMLMI